MTSQKLRWRLPCALVLLWLAAGISLALALAGPGKAALPGCADAGPGCHSVLGSVHASILGLPAAWLGVMGFSLLLLTCGAWARREPTGAAALGAMLAGVVTGGIIWFVGVQAVLMKQWCPWCLAAHAAGLSAVALLLLERRSRRASALAGAFPLTGLTLAGFALAAMTAGGSAWKTGALLSTPVPSSMAAVDTVPTVLPVGSLWSLDLGSHQMPMDLSLFPAGGTPGADRTAFLLTDYTCPHCRGYGPFVEEVASGRGNPVRLILLPGTRDAGGAAIHRVLLTLFHADPSAWRKLHDRLLSGALPATAEEVALAARLAVGETPWRAACATHSKAVDRAIAAARAVQAESRRRFPDAMLPQLLAGTEVLMGAEGDRSRVTEFLTAHAHRATPSLPGPKAPTSPTPSALALLEPDFAVGTLPASSKTKISLRLINSSLKPMPVPRLEMPEGCLVTSFPKGDIAATSTSGIDVECTVPAATGSFQKFIVLHPPGAPSLTARLHGMAESGTTSVASEPRPQSNPIPHVPAP